VHLRSASCKGAFYGTDQSAEAHDAHEFFPHRWSPAVSCTGWTEAEACAAKAVDAIRAHAAEHREPDGVVLEAHPGVVAEISQLLTPDYPGEDDERIGHRVTELFGVRLVPGPLAPAGWRLTADRSSLRCPVDASPVVRQAIDSPVEYACGHRWSMGELV
jgi:hypothetical protein